MGGGRGGHLIEGLADNGQGWASGILYTARPTLFLLTSLQIGSYFSLYSFFLLIVFYSIQLLALFFLPIVISLFFKSCTFLFENSPYTVPPFILRTIQYTDRKENQIFLIYKEIQSGAVAKSYMRKCANISPYMRRR